MRVLCCSLAVLLSACTVGPNYKRPSLPVPDQHRGDPAPGQASLADTRWPDLFPDDTLKPLISTALAHNFDLALASERVEEARARYRIAGASQYPFLYADEKAGTVRTSTIGSVVQFVPGSSTNATYTQTGAALSWELDLWGRNPPSEGIRARRILGHGRSQTRRHRVAHRRRGRQLLYPARARFGTADRPRHARHRRSQPGS